MAFQGPVSLKFTGGPLHSRALAHSRTPLFTQPCSYCSHSRAPGEQWTRLCVFTLQGCVQAARLCRGSPVVLWVWNSIRVSFRSKNFAHSTWSNLLWCVTNVLLKNVIIQYLDLLIKLQEKGSHYFTLGHECHPNGAQWNGYCCKENKSTVIIETQFINISANWYQYKHILAKHIMLAKWKKKRKKQ